MINYVTANLLDSNAEALVNTVNTQGVMGKGIALQFKNRFPENYKVYRERCLSNNLHIGDLLITQEDTLLNGKKTIINFPTKTNWRLPSEYSYIEAGLATLVKEIEGRGIKSIAIPPLGAGNGGLDWQRVKSLLEQYLSNLNCDIIVYEPNAQVQETLQKERVKLTPARAMLLSVLYDLVKNGEFVSEFSAEKVAYFLQRFGAKEFKLNYHPNFYGPYSGKVKHVLYYLNGSYITGYSAKDKKPFEELGLVAGGEVDVLQYLQQPDFGQQRSTVDLTKSFLKGFYSAFGLELLSTVDFIMTTKKVNSVDTISTELATWSHRKKTLFVNKNFIETAINNIQMYLPINQE